VRRVAGNSEHLIRVLVAEVAVLGVARHVRYRCAR
jgi:hypothetical protein